VDYAGEPAGPIAVDLTYVTRRAQWMPHYDARHMPAEGDRPERIELTSVAMVRQSTGEDWIGVELIATTARPPPSKPPPRLRTINVGCAPKGKDKQIVSTMQLGRRLGGVSKNGADEPMIFEHVAPGKVDVASNHRAVRIELFQLTFPATTRLEAAPIERPVVT